MRAFKALFHKEILEHGLAVVLLVSSLVLMLGLTLWGVHNQQSKTSNLVFLPVFLLSYVLVAASLLANRLVVREYQAHTQNFLETLPLRRWQVVTLKYFLGLGILVGVISMLVAAGCLAALSSEPVGWQFAGFLLLRSLGYLYCLWGACFLVGFTGRFRPPLVGAFWLALMVAAGGTDLHPWDFPPLGLIEPSVMPYNRTTLPLLALLQSAVLGTLLAGAGIWLATWREGSWVRRLSGRLSQAEKAMLAIALMSCVLFFSVVDLKRAKEPFHFQQEAVLTSPAAPLQILYLHDSARPSAQSLAAWLGPRLAALQTELKMDSLPPIHIALNESADGQTLETAQMGHNDGVLLRCNFTDSKFDRADLGALVVHRLLCYRTQERATLDPNHWFLDGFSVWFMDPHNAERREEALWVTRDHFPTRAEIEAWQVGADRQGTRVMESFAASGLAAMEKAYGRPAILDLARTLYVRPVHCDLREQLYQWTHPLSQLFARSTGKDYQSFFPLWQSWLEQQGAAQAVSDKYGRPMAHINVGKNGIDYSLSFASPPPAGLTWALLHAEAGPFDKVLPEQLFKREEHLWPASRAKQAESLEDVYSPGDRVLVGIEVQFPHKAHPLRILTLRKQIP